MAKNIIITCDSTADLSPELYAQYDVRVVPLYSTLDEAQYRDGVDITPDEIYAFVEQTKRLPKTAAASMPDYLDFFTAIQEKEDAEIIHFNISSSLSVTHNNARMAAEELEGVYVIDSQNLSTGTGLLVLKACDLVKQGLPAEEIVAQINDLRPMVDASFVVDTLEFLHKGGRCTALAALGANLLKLKPCIEVKSGAMGVGKKYRGRMLDVLQEYAAARLDNIEDVQFDRVFVTHSGCDQKIIDAVVEKVKSLAPFKEVLVTRAGCTVSTHCGPGTLGVLFIRKSPLQ